MSTEQPHRPATTSRRDHDRDRGAALIVAIAFMVAIGAMSAGLAAMVTSGISNRIALEQIRDRQYAADGAIEDAVADMRTYLAAASSRAATPLMLVVAPDRRAGPGRRDRSRGVAGAGVDGLPVRQPVVRFDACVDDGPPCDDRTVVVRSLVGFELDRTGARDRQLRPIVERAAMNVRRHHLDRRR